MKYFLLTLALLLISSTIDARIIWNDTTTFGASGSVNAKYLLMGQSGQIQGGFGFDPSAPEAIASHDGSYWFKIADNADVVTNTASIVENSLAIMQNYYDIATNTASIVQNVLSISNNYDNIATNTASISEIVADYAKKNDPTQTITASAFVGDGSGLTGVEAGASTLSELTDTNISTPSNGQVLKYNGSEWENSAQDAGNPRIIASFNAEDQDISLWSTTSLTNATFTVTSSSINGSYSYQFSNITSSASEYACTPNITLPEFGRGKHIGFRMAYGYDGDTDDMKVWLEDVTNGATISYELLEAGNKDVLVAGFSQSTTANVRACFQIYAENNGKNLIMDNLEFVVSPLRSIKLQITETASHSSSTMISDNGELRFTLSNIEESGENVFDISDDGTRTKFTAVKNNVYMSYHLSGVQDSAQSNIRVRLNGNIVGYGSLDSASASSTVGGNIKMNKDDYLSFEIVAGDFNNTVPIFLYLTARTDADATVSDGNYGIQLYEISQAAASMSDTSGEYRFNLSTATINNFTSYGEFIQAIDDTVYADNRTRFQALSDTTVTIDWSANGDNDAEFPYLYKNDLFYQRGGTPGANGQEFGMSTSIRLQAGEYFSIGYSGNTSGTVVLKFRAEPSQKVTNIITPATQTVMLEERMAHNTGLAYSLASNINTRQLTHIDGLDASSTAKSSKFATLDSWQVTIPSGIYTIAQTVTTASDCNRNQPYLYNVTDSVLISAGLNGESNDSADTIRTSFYHVELTKPTVIESRHWVFQACDAGNGTGYAGNTEVNYGVLGQLKITKVK